MMYAATAFLTLLSATLALAQSGAYGQCGGTGWSGATTCVSGYTCNKINDWYSQCIPGTAPPVVSTSLPPLTTIPPVTSLPPTVTVVPPATSTIPPNTDPAPTSATGNTANQEGRHDGFFYSWWSDRGGQATFQVQAGGTYMIRWSGNGNLVGGKGWNPGTTTRVISYNGTYNPNGNSYHAIYGWTRNKLIEYYVVESYGTYNPSSAASRKGTVTCNGANYDILETTRTNQPSIDGTATFQQFWSVRNPKKNPGGAISGTVDTACHFSAWERVGMRLGTDHYYQIVATEGYFSSGSAIITVSGTD